MRDLREIRGLKYPDEFVVRHAFKRGLSERTGHVLELGCGTGNNLGLYLALGWTATGVDNDPAALADCRFNHGAGVTLIEADLAKGPAPVSGTFNAAIIPNLLCYLTEAQARTVLSGLRPQLSPGCEVFVRTRLTDDFRYGRGNLEEPDGYRLATPETGEAGLFNRFYTVANLTELLVESLGLQDPTALTCRFDNIQAGVVVPGNSDVIVWGRTA